MSKVLVDEQLTKRGRTMARVLVADEISKEGIAILETALEVVYDPNISPEKLLETVGEFDALLVRSRSKVTKAVIEAGKRLKLVGRAGVGVDNIDITAATEQGILVVNSPEGNTASAAEHAVALMFALARNIPEADLSMKNGQWERAKFLGTELFNKTLGVVGLGKVGSRVALAAQGVGMKVIGFDPLISAERAQQLNIQAVSLEEIWKRSDFISLHIPKTAQTTNLINEETIAKLKPGVRIINAARGGVIDEDALAKAIKEGRVAGAALDVFSSEPPAKDSKLLELGNKVVLTPHLGASTVEAQFNVAIDLAEQIRDYMTGGMVHGAVNLPFMRPEIMRVLGRWLWLAEAMGTIAGELCEGAVKHVEVTVQGNLAQKDTSPLAIAALRGLFAPKIETVTYVNAQLIAKNHGIQVREVKAEYDNPDEEYVELTVTVSGDKDRATVSGTVLGHNEAIITKINEFPINLSPQRYMLFTSHRDQPGMVAKVAGILGKFDINISTMAVARKGVRQEAVMVMSLDDPIKPELIRELSNDSGIHMARLVTLENVSPVYE